MTVTLGSLKPPVGLSLAPRFSALPLESLQTLPLCQPHLSSLLGVPGEATHSKCPVLISMAQGLPQGLETPNKCHRQRFMAQ